jgi:hypothetical protein
MKNRRDKHKGDGEIRKLFMQQLLNTLKDSEFMEGVMDELIELYEKNTDEQNELEFDENMLPDMLAKCVEMEWYEVAARIHKQMIKTETNVEAR